MTNRVQKLNDLKQQRSGKVEAQGVLIAALDADEGRDIFTEDEERRFNDLEEEICSFDSQIESLEKIVKSEQRAAAVYGAPVGGSEEDEKNKIFRTFSYVEAIKRAKSGRQQEGAEKEVSEIGAEEARNAGVTVDGNASFHLPASMVRADAQTVTEDGGDYGSHLVIQESSKYIQPLVETLDIQSLGVEVLSGLVGDLPLASLDEYDAVWVAETEDVPEQKTKSTGKIMKPKRLAVNVGVSNQLLIQANGLGDREIRRRIGRSINNKVSWTVFNGTGKKVDGNIIQPLGLLNIDGVQVSPAVAGVPDFKKIVELESLVEEASAVGANLSYVFPKKLKQILKTTKIDPGSGKFLLEGDMLNGESFLATTLIEALSNGSGGFTYPMIFGDFRELFVGFWGGASIGVDPYTKMGGNRTRLILNLHADIATANPKAFAVNKKFTLS